MTVEISDDGIGLPRSAIRRGLTGMQERVRALSGTLELLREDGGPRSMPASGNFYDGMPQKPDARISGQASAGRSMHVEEPIARATNHDHRGHSPNQQYRHVLSSDDVRRWNRENYHLFQA